jgi:hypothetical protein
MKQQIATLTDALEQSMKIEAMARYPGNLRVTRPPIDANLVQLQGKISTLTKNSSGSDDTHTKMTIGLVHWMLYERSFGERMSTTEGNGKSSESDGIPTRKQKRSCTSVDELTIP